MTWKPTIKLYASDGTTPVYTFSNVIDLPDQDIDNPDFVEHTNLRSQGSIIIPGGNKTYAFRIRGVLSASNYTALRVLMTAMQSAIVNNTNYVLKVDASISTTDSYNVKRLKSISWSGSAKKTKIQYYEVEFLAYSW